MHMLNASGYEAGCAKHILGNEVKDSIDSMENPLRRGFQILYVYCRVMIFTSTGLNLNYGSRVLRSQKSAWAKKILETQQGATVDQYSTFYSENRKAFSFRVS